MPIRRDLPLELNVDMVLRGQGADPNVLRKRSPQLIPIAQDALDEGMKLAQPVMVFERVNVRALRHERLILERGELSGAFVPQRLAAAEQIIALIVSIGDAVESRIAELMEDDPVYALALDGFGSAAVEAIAAQACREFEENAQAQGLKTTIPLSPGMLEWSVDQGQPQIFRLLDANNAGIQLTESFMMLPRKSTSAVLGLGKNISEQRHPCDYCAMNQTCRFQQRHN